MTRSASSLSLRPF